MNILIVGLGSIAAKHIAALWALGVDARFSALRSSKDASTTEGITNIFDLSDTPKNLHFAIVSNPTHLHAQTIRSLLPLKIPLFIEKPVLLTAEGADELLREIEQARILTYVGCHLRFHPCIIYLKKLLSPRAREGAHLDNNKPAAPLRGCGTVREVRAYNGSLVTDWQPGCDFSKSFRRSAAESGGVHLELIHELDFVTWLFGMPERSAKVLRRDTDLTLDAPDFAHYDLDYTGFRASITLSYYDPTPQRTLAIVCNDATYTADLRAFSVRKGEEVVYAPGGTIADVYAAQMRYFLDCITRHEPLMNDFSEALSVLRLALT